MSNDIMGTVLHCEYNTESLMADLTNQQTPRCPPCPDVQTRKLGRGGGEERTDHQLPRQYECGAWVRKQLERRLIAEHISGTSRTCQSQECNVRIGL